MTRGSWELEGETIKFLKDGTLVDGQHRLTEGGLIRTAPVLRPSRKLLSRQAVINPLRPVEAVALIALSWNAYAASQEMTSLTWTDKDGFPRIK